MPTLDKTQALTFEQNNSAPGPDGMPYAAWSRIPTAAQALLDAATDVLKGSLGPLDFNDSLMTFVPEGS
eukprot:5882811-Pyramimonas_sp.AAC.1